MNKFSAYFASLSGDVKCRYLEKLNLISDIDPYCVNISDCTKDLQEFPSIHYFDIMNYLKCAKSAYTNEELRALKSSQAYATYFSGWVRDVAVQKIGNLILILGQVLHSQRVTAKPLKPWVISKPDGEVLCAHCDCTAGLGESCTHVGALLFAIEDAVRNYNPVSVTSQKAYWVRPSNTVGSQQKLKALDFTAPRRKVVEETPGCSKISAEEISSPDEDKKREFLNSLKNLPHLSSILLVKDPYCFEIAQEACEEEQQYLTALFDEDYIGKTLNELENIIKDIDFSMTDEQCDYIELQTRGSQSKTWFGHRRGRVTASMFKRACRTKVEKPSISLIKQICYPEKYSFSTTATKYGCSHEKIALKAYEEVMKTQHTDCTLSTVGLVVNRKYTHFGATPDSLVTCKFHGEGCVEVKCPFCARDINVLEIRHMKNMCLKGQGKNIMLDRNHSYYYQVQMQLALTERKYCDFVVWSSKNMYIERIIFDEAFWKMENSKAAKFHRHVILPELLGKYYTKNDSKKYIMEETTWCKCKKPDSGTPMIACESINCETVWFHFDCVGLNDTPTSPWVCDVCSQSSK